MVFRTPRIFQKDVESPIWKTQINSEHIFSISIGAESMLIREFVKNEWGPPQQIFKWILATWKFFQKEVKFSHF